jgi:hypothetical protein
MPRRWSSPPVRHHPAEARGAQPPGVCSVPRRRSLRVTATPGPAATTPGNRLTNYFISQHQFYKIMEQALYVEGRDTGQMGYKVVPRFDSGRVASEQIIVRETAPERPRGRHRRLAPVHMCHGADLRKQRHVIVIPVHNHERPVTDCPRDAVPSAPQRRTAPRGQSERPFRTTADPN